MGLKSVVRTIWTLAAATPLLALAIHWNGMRALALVLLYVAGWVAIAAGFKRDPDGERLRGFLTSRMARALAVGGFVAVQILFAVYPPHWTTFLLMLFAVWILWLWVFAGSSESIAAWTGRLVALACSLVLTLALIEGVLALASGARPPDDRVHYTWGCPIHNNRFGFRERDFEIPKPKNVYRVMVLGDSFTWGAGLREEQRYTNLTEAYLKGRVPGIEVLNFGIPGGPTTKERDLLREQVSSVDPNLVVVGYCINDPQPLRQDYAVEIERYRRLFGIARTLDSIGCSRTAVLVNELTAGVLRRTGRVPEWPTALDRTYDPNSAEWKAFEQALADIRTICDEHHLPPPVFEPFLYANGDYNKPDRDLKMILKWTRQAADAARRHGFEVVNLEPDFMAQGNKVRWVNRWDGHPNAECNVIYARRLAEAILRTTYR